MLATTEKGVIRNNAWFLDSGCSNHMCGDKGMFAEIKADTQHFVKCGNNSRMKVVGTGSVRLKFNGTTFLISDVYYVPKLQKNLLSIGQLQEKGLAIVIQNGACNIYHSTKGLIIDTNMSTNRMFILFNERSTLGECLHTSSDLTY